MVKEVNFTEKVPISHHLIEIKDRVIQVALVVALFFGLSFYFIDILLLSLEDPLPKQFADLTFITPTEPFFTNMKVAFMGSVFISMPWILYHLWGFIAPGLKVKEKKITALFVFFGTMFFLFGGIFCYFLVLPLGLKFLLAYGSNFWKMQVTKIVHCYYGGFRAYQRPSVCWNKQARGRADKQLCTKTHMLSLIHI